MPELRIPVGRHARRVFWSVVIGACVVLLVARFFAIPALFDAKTPAISDVLDQSLGDIISTVLAATVLSAVVLWLSAPSRKPSDLTVVHPKDIGPKLEEHLSTTRTWTYSGSVGRWNRARAMPELARHARESNSGRDVLLQILDPREERACHAYAEYRRGVRTGTGTRDEDWTIRRVRRDIYATIVAAAALAHREPLLRVRIALKPWTSVFRFDASDRRIVITREDPKEPGLVCETGTYFYDAFREGMRFELDQAVELQLPQDGHLQFETLSVGAVRTFLHNLGLGLPDLESDGEVELIIAEAKSGLHPYARA
jgi:hypothetical protein